MDETEEGEVQRTDLEMELAFQLEKLQAEHQDTIEVLWRHSTALRMVMENIGVPQEGCPSNIAHAYHIAQEAYAHAREGKLLSEYADLESRLAAAHMLAEQTLERMGK